MSTMVSHHQPYYCLHNRSFRRRWKKTSKLRVTGLRAGNSQVTGEFTAQRASNAEKVSIWWRHHGSLRLWDISSVNFIIIIWPTKSIRNLCEHEEIGENVAKFSVSSVPANLTRVFHQTCEKLNHVTGMVPISQAVMVRWVKSHGNSKRWVPSLRFGPLLFWTDVGPMPNSKARKNLTYGSPVSRFHC